MANKTAIDYADYTVNPLRVRGGKVWKHGYHCTKCSPGCENCYAERLNIWRGTGLPFRQRDDVDWYVDLSVFDALPKKPLTVFVQNMSDLFHESAPDAMIDDVFQRVFADTHGHRFLFLTKRARRMHEYFQQYEDWGGGSDIDKDIYLGLTVCNQKEANEKIPTFLQMPGKKWLSIEPMLEGIDIGYYLHDCPEQYSDGEWTQTCERPDWIVVGCESGPKRRECKLEWIADIVRQCDSARVPVFVKQVEINGRVSHNPAEWTEALRRRRKE